MSSSGATPDTENLYMEVSASLMTLSHLYEVTGTSGHFYYHYKEQYKAKGIHNSL